MNITKKTFIVITLIGILFAASAYGYDESSQEKGRGNQGPPPEAYCACEGKSAGDTAEFTSPQGDTVTGTCEEDRDGDRLVLRPDNAPEGGQGERPMRGDRD
jgi:hypothetical protein